MRKSRMDDRTTVMEKPDLYVVARILERLWREQNPIVRTKLQQSARINYGLFVRYLFWMEQKGLVTCSNSPNGHEGIVLTPDGEEAYRRIVQWINEVVRGVIPGP